MIKVVSLFSGCGGFDWGFKSEKYQIIWSNDFLQDACITYEKNFDKQIVCEDINKVSLQEIPQSDIVLGGPPCQSFSLVGKRDPNDKRSSLVWMYLKIINHIKPKIFLMENVTGLKSSKNSDGKVIDNLTEAFRKLGYHIDIHTLNAADYGVPQRRKRVFIVGNLQKITIDAPLVTHSEDGKTLPKWVSSYEALSDLGDTSENGVSKYVSKPKNKYQELMRDEEVGKVTLHFTPYSSSKDMQIIRAVKPGGNYMDVPDNIATTRILNFKKTGGRTTTYGRLDPNKPAYTLNTHFNRPNVGCNIHYSKNRLISIREGLRLQSFPDNFELLSKSKRNYYLLVGNAVPPLLGQAWARHLKKYI